MDRVRQSHPLLACRHRRRQSLSLSPPHTHLPTLQPFPLLMCSLYISRLASHAAHTPRRAQANRFDRKTLGHDALAGASPVPRFGRRSKPPPPPPEIRSFASDMTSVRSWVERLAASRDENDGLRVPPDSPAAAQFSRAAAPPTVAPTPAQATRRRWPWSRRRPQNGAQQAEIDSPAMRPSDANWWAPTPLASGRPIPSSIPSRPLPSPCGFTFTAGQAQSGAVGGAVGGGGESSSASATCSTKPTCARPTQPASSSSSSLPPKHPPSNLTKKPPPSGLASLPSALGCSHLATTSRRPPEISRTLPEASRNFPSSLTASSETARVERGGGVAPPPPSLPPSFVPAARSAFALASVTTAAAPAPTSHVSAVRLMVRRERLERERAAAVERLRELNLESGARVKAQVGSANFELPLNCPRIAA